MVNLAQEIKLYSQYTTSEKWINWYARVLPFKAKRTIKILEEYQGPEAILLDVGCSTGLTLGFIAKRFKKIIGYDIDKKAIKIAKNRFKKMGLKAKFILGRSGKIPLKNNSVEIVTSIEVFEHLNQPKLVLSEIHRVLKPNGILHITTANKLWLIEPHFHLPFLSYLPKKWADFYVRVTKKGKSYDDINLPTYRQFREAVEQYFQVEDITLQIIKDYQKYEMDKERGGLIIAIALFLRFLDRVKKVPGLSVISDGFEKCLLNFSLGWLFICRPKKR